MILSTHIDESFNAQASNFRELSLNYSDYYLFGGDGDGCVDILKFKFLEWWNWIKTLFSLFKLSLYLSFTLLLLLSFSRSLFHSLLLPLPRYLFCLSHYFCFFLFLSFSICRSCSISFSICHSLSLPTCINIANSTVHLLLAFF